MGRISYSKWININQILFIYRLKKWDLPKGKLDKGETIRDCAKREVEEETKVKVNLKQKINCHISNKLHKKYWI